MVFQFEKLSVRVQELESLRYINKKPLEGLTIHEDDTKDQKYPPEEIKDSAKALASNSLWEGRDKYFWIMGELEVPSIDNGDDFLLLFDFGKSNDGNTSGFEAMLYINGEPYQAVDGNHKEVFIDNAYSGKKVKIALRLWGGLEGGGAAGEIWHHSKYADQAVLSAQVDDLYYTSLVMIETIEILDINDPVRIRLLGLLDDSFNKINWSDKLSKEFLNSLHIANDNLQSEIDKLEKHSDINVTMIGHTHIDVAWLWRLKHTREKAARSFSTVFRLMEQYPEYIFLQTQPQVYEYIKEDFPEMYEKIKEKVREGRWEIEGAMWLESDANIPSGESLVRQILMGSRFIKEEFNKETKYLWLPDVFGYSWALPQILKKSGIELFMTTKISWNQFNRMPNDTFYWKGIDGTEILTHFITTPVPGNTDEFFYTYNGEINPYTVKGLYDSYRDKDLNSDLLIAYGYGDGGGGVNREQLEKARRINKLPGLPNIKSDTAGHYFKELSETIKKAKENGKYVHTWDGELYLEYHRGTYTSQAKNKLWNRKLELLYRDAEIISSWASQFKNQKYPQKELNDGWKTILRNQFHDIIPGSSIKEVYEDSDQEYLETEKHGKNVLEKFNQLIKEDDNTWTVINTSAWNRNELITIRDINGEGIFVDNDGNEMEASFISNEATILVDNIPALGSKIITFKESEKHTAGNPSIVANGNEMSTPFYIINWNDKGHLVSIYDKKAEREVLSKDGAGNVFQLFEDKPLNWDAWDIDLFYQDKGIDITFESVKIKEINHLYAEVEFSASFGESKLNQKMRIYSHNRRIDFETDVDWKERQQLLKVKFDVDVRGTEATYDIQYGNAKRPTHWNTSWDMAKFESVGHQWADLSEKGFGVSLLNNCKYGYDIKENTMRLSLLKGAIYPDPEADLGKHQFTYSLYPHEGDFVEGRTVVEAWNLNSSVHLYEGQLNMNSLFDIQSEYPVMIDAIKKAEGSDGMILRLHDYTGGRQKVNIKPSFDYKSCSEVNLMEKNIRNERVFDGDSINFDLNPYEIVTFLIE